MGKLKKMFTASVVFAAAVFALSTAAFAAQDIKLNMNGKAAAFNESNKPVIIDGSTMLQVRAMYDLLNEDGSYSLDWNDAEKTATFKNAKTTVKIWAGKSEAEVNGKKVTINGAAPRIIDGRLYVPFRFLAESFGMTVSWNDNNKTIGMMDDETLDIVYGLMSNSGAEADESSKTYMEMKYDIAMVMESAGESMTISMKMDAVIEQDMANKYQHIKMTMDMSMGALGAGSSTAEMYDDGVNSYTSTDGGGFVKGESSFSTAGDFAEQLMNQVDFAALTELEKSSYTAILIKTDSAGNYVLEGSLIIPDDILMSMMGAVSGDMGMDGLMDGVSVSIPDPIYVTYVFNKDTGALMSMKMDYGMNMTMDTMGEKVATNVKYKIDVPKIDTNASFSSVVPDSVKK